MAPTELFEAVQASNNRTPAYLDQDSACTGSIDEPVCTADGHKAAESENKPLGISTVGIPRAIALWEWDTHRFKFLRRLHATATVRSGRRLELYKDTLLGKAVLAKRFLQEHAHSGGKTEKLRAVSCRNEKPWPEIAITQRLGCTGRSRPSFVCACYGAFRSERGDVLLVTEYVPGGDLFDLARSLGEPGREREERVMPIIRSLLAAVLKLHKRGVAHCDISLENALWRPRGEVVLIDFETAVTSGLGKVTGIRGKPSYQAPEMYSCKTWDARAADLFSCGVAAYSLALGRYPWKSTRPCACPEFAFFSEHGLHAFLQPRQVPWGGASRRSAAECMSPQLMSLLSALLHLTPSARHAGLNLLQ